MIPWALFAAWKGVESERRFSVLLFIVRVIDRKREGSRSLPLIMNSIKLWN